MFCLHPATGACAQLPFRLSSQTQYNATKYLSRGDEAEPWIARCMLFLQMKLNNMAMPQIYAMVNYYHDTNDILSEGGPEMVCLTPSDEWYSSQLAASSSLSYCNLIQI